MLQRPLNLRRPCRIERLKRMCRLNVRTRLVLALVLQFRVLTAGPAAGRTHLFHRQRTAFVSHDVERSSLHVVELASHHP